MLTTNQITDIERGVDAGFDVLLELNARGMVAANSRGDAQATKAYMDFGQSVVEHRQALASQALQRALISHPQLEGAEVSVEPQP